MSELTKSDAELVYKYLPESLRGDVEAEAYTMALEEFNAEETALLEKAHEDEDSSFEWGSIHLEFAQRDRDREELVPMTGVDHRNEPTLYDIANDFGWLYIEHVRHEIRALRESTAFSPREFVALVVGGQWGEKNAATIMDISVGNYRSKKGAIASKIDEAETTLEVVEKVRE